MNRLARSGSTGFQVPPSTLRSDPTIAPSATARKSRTLVDLTPVFAKTGVSSPHPRLASRTASTEGSAPAMGPYHGAGGRLTPEGVGEYAETATLTNLFRGPAPTEI